MKDDDLFEKQVSLISKYHKETLVRISHKRGIPVSRLVCTAIDNELLKEKIFELDLELPPANQEHAYDDEAGKILAFMKRHLDVPLTLDNYMLLRHDIGVPDRQLFLEAFSVLLDRGYIYEVPQAKFHQGVRRIQEVYKVKGLSK